MLKKFLNVLLLFIFVFLTPLCVFSDEVKQEILKTETIWDEQDNEFLDDLEKAPIDLPHDYYKKLDAEVEFNLSLKLEYTNLQQCIEAAMLYNYNIRIINDIKNSKKWLYHNSQAQFVPDFAYQYQISRIRGEFLVGNVLEASLKETTVYSDFLLGWDSLNIPKTFFNMRAARKTYDAAKKNLEFSKEEILLKTGISYYEVLEQKLNIEVLKINLKERETQLKITQGRYLIGVGTKFDILRAEAQVAQAKQQYIQAFNNLRLKQAKLANIIGVDVLEPIYPFETGVNIVNLVDKKYSIEELYEVALSIRDDINAKQKEIESLENTRKAQLMDFAPNINLQFQYEKVALLGSPMLSNNRITLIGTLPLGRQLGVGTMTMVKTYDAQISQRKNELLNLKRGIKEDILNSYYDSLTALERIEAAKKEVAAGDEGLKNALVRWDIGEATFLDVLQAQTTKTTARQELINSMIAYNKAQVQLLFDTGLITVKSILKDYILP